MREKVAFPVKAAESRRVQVYRETRGSITRMLDDAYNVLGQQFDHFKEYSSRNRFSDKECAGFAKLISSLTSLQESERRQISQLALGALSDAEIEQLGEQARQTMQIRGVSTPDREH